MRRLQRHLGELHRLGTESRKQSAKKGSPLKADASLMRVFRDVFDKAAQRLRERSREASAECCF